MTPTGSRKIIFGTGPTGRGLDEQGPHFIKALNPIRCLLLLADWYPLNLSAMFCHVIIFYRVMPDIATLEENVSESEESQDEPIRYFVVHNTTQARGK